MTKGEIRSDKRPHTGRDRCVFGCCEVVAALVHRPTPEAATLCVLCGEAIPAREMSRAWQQVTGFAVPRHAGGANYIARKEPTGRYCHPICGETSGATAQGGMF